MPNPDSVLITGASSGIGQATARRFAEGGHPLLLAARRRDRLEALARELGERFGVAVGLAAVDVRDPLAGRLCRQQFGKALDGLGIVVNNAGLSRGRDPVHLGSGDDWDEMIDTNLKGLLRISREFLPDLVRRGRGDVINIGSVAGRQVYAGGNVYCATKHAVRAISESLQIELLGTGVRVCDLQPGLVETEFSDVRFRGDRQRAQAVYQGMTPLKADDVAAAIYWVATRPRHVSVHEMLLMPADQASVHHIQRRT
jgi:NADP-dependent 3-hydroxy acid dehydrogenase YdfG